MMMAGRRLFTGAGLGFALAFTLPAAAQAGQPGATPTRLQALPDSDVVSDSDSAPPAAETRGTSARSDASAPAATPAVPLAAMNPRQLYEHVRRGVVVLERGGMPAALGTVLAGDGRVLTALSGLAGATSVDVRYADGTAVHGKVAYSDPSVDLALVAPETAHRTAEATRTEGLTASESDPATTLIRAMLPGRVGHLGPSNVGVKGPAEAHARDGAPLFRMLDVDVQGIPVVGAPLLDPAGNVVAVLVRACKGVAHVGTPDSPLPGAWPGAAPAARAQPAADTACQPVLVGASIATVRSFLTKMMSSAAAPPAATPASAGDASGAGTGPWLGIRGEPQDAGGMHGVRVVDVAPSSPAEKAGLKPGADVIVAVDGRPIDKPDALGESISKHAAGDSVKLLVFGGGKFREVTTVLRAAP
ncbi:MAG TPA: PDZ domain-containing protein [Polyangiaceae bacterium]|nr:PDZ domain-containing protein [Polyangiaceae bacterium]